MEIFKYKYFNFEPLQRSYHYQDYQNREVDCVIELENGEWCAFEIKLGANKIEEAVRNCKKM